MIQSREKVALKFSFRNVCLSFINFSKINKDKIRHPLTVTSKMSILLCEPILPLCRIRMQ